MMDMLVSVCIFVSVIAGAALVVERRSRAPERALKARQDGCVDTNRYTPPLSQPVPRAVANLSAVQTSRHIDVECIVLRFESAHEQVFLMTKALDRVSMLDAAPTAQVALSELIDYLICVRRLVEPFRLCIGVKVRERPDTPSFAESIEFLGTSDHNRLKLIHEKLLSSLQRHLEKLGA